MFEAMLEGTPVHLGCGEVEWRRVADPATVETFSTADTTYIREYVRASSGETAATTLAGQPVSWWKISGVTNGVKLEQSVKGIQREKTWLASNSSSLVVADGDKQTSTIVTMPNSPGQPFSAQTEITEGTARISKRIVNYESSGTEYAISDEVVYLDPASGPGLMTAYGYYPSTAGSDAAGKLWWISRPDGSWVVYSYPGNGERIKVDPACHGYHYESSDSYRESVAERRFLHSQKRTNP